METSSFSKKLEPLLDIQSEWGKIQFFNLFAFLESCCRVLQAKWTQAPGLRIEVHQSRLVSCPVQHTGFTLNNATWSWISPGCKNLLTREAEEIVSTLKLDFLLYKMSTTWILCILLILNPRSGPQCKCHVFPKTSSPSPNIRDNLNL